MFAPDFYYTVMGAMVITGFMVFFALQHIAAGYGVMYTSKWGPSVGNRAGWVCMELPAFAGMIFFWLFSPRDAEAGAVICATLFLLHYFQRTFIFPMLMRGRSRMPWIIIVLGMVFNFINTYLIGGWLFYLSPEGMYSASWLRSPQFIAGTLLFFTGMGINLHSDHIVRHLRKPGDTRHYIPRGGMYRYVTSANYLGEFVEWIGFAVLTWSLAGVVFAFWTFANLAPRAKKLHSRYISEFGDSYKSLNRKYIIPFIY